jgi:hypothetical protein
LAERLSTYPAATFALTGRGREWFAALDIDVAALASRKRSFARACLDWTERRPHLAGALGAALADTFVARQWLSRRPGSRAVMLTATGAEFLEQKLERRSL